MPDILTADEQSLITDRSFLLAKRTVLAKVFSELAASGQQLQTHIKSKHSLIYNSYGLLSPKVSKGENYHGLPYQVMDYPRHFDEENTFSFRVIFLWGHYLSCSLHLGRNLVKPDTIASVQLMNPIFLGIASTPWEHYLTADNYKDLASADHEEIRELATKNKFIKLAERYELKDINNLSKLTIKSFDQLTSISGLI
jgi:hypothetical protein